jgi:alpha-L-fucosidase 2
VDEEGPISDQTFYLGEENFFTGGGIEPVGRVVVRASGFTNSSYLVRQDIANAEVLGRYSLAGQTLETTSWVDANSNVLFTEFYLAGTGGAQSIGVSLQDGAGATPPTSRTGNDLDVNVCARNCIPNDPVARIAARTIGGTQTISGNNLTVTIHPGHMTTLAIAIESNVDTPNYNTKADSRIGHITQAGINRDLAAHINWWHGYWSKSFVEIPDQAIEKSWYGSLYLLASATRPGNDPPGLWANWIPQRGMNWNGDYHTNYNYEAPFWSAITTNHIAEMADYATPILQYESQGKAWASQNGYQGVYYPVGLGPNGETTDANFHDQKSNAAYLASDMIMEYEYTQSKSYAASMFPWLVQVADFWQGYLQWDPSTGTYMDYNDAPQEDNPNPETNPVLTIGLIHLLLSGLIDMAHALNQDTSMIPTWRHILRHLPPFATTTYNGQTVFAETSQGVGFFNDDATMTNPIYPALAIGLDSPSRLIRIGRNTVNQETIAWQGENAPTFFYPAAAYIGYNPSTIMSNLHIEATDWSFNNMAIHHNGGGLENLNQETEGVDAMLLQSYQRDIKVFPDWPAHTNAKFGDLRAWGNFLVSASKANNSVQYEQVFSGSGRRLTFTNPWPGQRVQYYANGTNKGTLSGTRITISTQARETIELARAGTSLSKIRAELGQPMVGASTVAGQDCAASPFGTRQLNESGFRASSNTPSAQDSPQNAITNAVNGTDSTRFGSDEGQAVGMTYTVDMRSPQTFDEIQMDAPNSPTDFAPGYDVKVSSNGSKWSTVASCPGFGTPEVVRFASRTARYVKVVLTAANNTFWWSMNAFRVDRTVRNLPPGPPPPTTTQGALGLATTSHR